MARSSLLHQGGSPRPPPAPRPGGLDEALHEPTSERPGREDVLATPQPNRPAQIPTGVPDVPGHSCRHVKVSPVEMLSIEGPLPHPVAAIESHLLLSASPRPMGHGHRRQISDRNSGPEQPVSKVVVFGSRRRGPRAEAFVE